MTPIQKESIKAGVTENFNLYGIDQFETENGLMTDDGTIALQEFTKSFISDNEIEVETEDAYAVVVSVWQEFAGV